MQSEKTIYALSSPLGGAIAIIRISGAKTEEILKSVFSGSYAHGEIAFGRLMHDGRMIDEIMAAFFRAPRSYTGEDMAELYIHGSAAVARETFRALSECGAYPAEAGEFSLRAFENGKMNLSDAEAVMDLINASAERSAHSAILQLSGALTQRIRSIETRIISILSQIDAIIDYPDEMEDADVTDDIREVLSDVECLMRHGMRARHIREGFSIAIVGKPNVGKSSLLNALVSEDKAIVTQVAGTTRDVIEAQTEMHGLPVRLFDTAGLHDTADNVERIGIERAQAVIDAADMCYVVIDASREITREDEGVFALTSTKPRIIILNKTDIAVGNYTPDGTYVRMSTVTGEGIEELKRVTADMICPDDESGIITNMRHVQALQDANDALSDALCAPETDCMAQDLNRALHALGCITGDAVDEDVITEIFSRFCVGK